MLRGAWPPEVVSDARATVRQMLAAAAPRQSLLEPLLESQWLKRLGGISFLGTLDAQPDARDRTTRLDHSVAVAESAMRVGMSAGLSDVPLATLVIAALLHDAGHFPLSHSAEAAFARMYGGTHHDVTRWIILGDGAVPERRSLRSAIASVGVDPAAVWALIAGERQGVVPDALAACFSSVLNIDTLEAIPRVAKAFGLPCSSPAQEPFVLGGGELVIPTAKVSQADRFWRLKDEVYVGVINRASNILLEEAVSNAASAISAEVLGPLETLDDDAFLSATSRVTVDLRLAERSYAVVPDPAGRRTRKRYRVDDTVSPGTEGLRASKWSRRYVHYRERVSVVDAAEVPA